MYVWDLVGNTPLVKIKSLSEATGCEIFAKCEFMNPGGSIKDRTAKGIIKQAEEQGKIKKGSIIIEGTAGNTGIGLATLAAERGYRVWISMPNNQSKEKYSYLKALGAKLFLVDPCPFANPKHFYHQARELSENTENSFWADQFENTANAKIHYQETGPEIWQQTQNKIDIVSMAVGTGGSMGGVSRFLKEKDSSISCVVSDPMGSGVYSYIHRGEFQSEGSSVTEGIGIMRKTANFAEAKVDDAIQVNDQEMLQMLVHLAKKDGLFVGTSSALNVMGAYKLARDNQGSGKRIVTILCDSATRYSAKILSLIEAHKPKELY